MMEKSTSIPENHDKRSSSDSPSGVRGSIKNIPEVVWQIVYNKSNLKPLLPEPVEVRNNYEPGVYNEKLIIRFIHKDKEEVERFMKFMEEVVSKRYSGAIKHIKETLEEVYEEVEKDLREEFEEKND